MSRKIVKLHSFIFALAASRVFGLAREVVTALYFGATALGDQYYLFIAVVMGFTVILNGVFTTVYVRESEVIVRGAVTRVAVLLSLGVSGSAFLLLSLKYDVIIGLISFLSMFLGLVYTILYAEALRTENRANLIRSTMASSMLTFTLSIAAYLIDSNMLLYYVIAIQYMVSIIFLIQNANISEVVNQAVKSRIERQTILKIVPVLYISGLDAIFPVLERIIVAGILSGAAAAIAISARIFGALFSMIISPVVESVYNRIQHRGHEKIFAYLSVVSAVASITSILAVQVVIRIMMSGEESFALKFSKYHLLIPFIVTYMGGFCAYTTISLVTKEHHANGESGHVALATTRYYLMLILVLLVIWGLHKDIVVYLFSYSILQCAYAVYWVVNSATNSYLRNNYLFGRLVEARFALVSTLVLIVLLTLWKVRVYGEFLG